MKIEMKIEMNSSRQTCYRLVISSDVDPDVGVGDIEERFDGVERLRRAGGSHRAIVERLADGVTAHGVDDVVNLRGAETEAGGWDGSLGHPCVVRGVVLLHGVSRDLGLLLAGVGLAADDDDGPVGHGDGGFVAAGGRHLSLLDPGGGAGGELEHGVVERGVGPRSGGVVVSADGVSLAAR